MPLIGVRELRERTAEVLRKVRSEKAEYVITHQGQPIAVLLPVDEKKMEDAIIEAGKRNAIARWETYARLADQISRAWPSNLKTQEIMDNVRR